MNILAYVHHKSIFFFFAGSPLIAGSSVILGSPVIAGSPIILGSPVIAESHVIAGSPVINAHCIFLYDVVRKLYQVDSRMRTFLLDVPGIASSKSHLFDRFT